MASIWTYKVHWVGKKKSTEWTSFSRIQLFVTPMNCGILFFFFSSTTLLLPTHLPPPPCTHAQSCNPMDCSPPGSCVHGLFQARILEWVAISFSSRPEYWSGYPFLSPGDLPNPGLPHCRQILYQLSHKGSPRILEWVAYPFSSRSSRSRNQIRVSCTAGRLFTNWAIREAQKVINLFFQQLFIECLFCARYRHWKYSSKETRKKILLFTELTFYGVRETV